MIDLPGGYVTFALPGNYVAVALPGGYVAVAGALPVGGQGLDGFLGLQGDPHVHHSVGVVDGLAVDRGLLVTDHLLLPPLTQGWPGPQLSNNTTHLHTVLKHLLVK